MSDPAPRTEPPERHGPADPGGALLVASIGNRHTSLGLVVEGEVVADWRVSTDDRRTADEWAALLHALPGRAARLGAAHGAGGAAASPGTVMAGLAGVAVCATVPSVLAEWRVMLARHFPDATAVLVEPGVRTGIAVRTDNPREVGADRIVNALAALTHHGAPAIVVDLGGTATTYDVVDAAGRYVGGAITPGIEVSLEALGRGGAQLRSVELVRPRSAIARNTVEALQAGMVFGMAAQVDGLVARMLAELTSGTSAAADGHPEQFGAPTSTSVAGRPVAVIATGPMAGVVLGECRSLTAHDPWLTLRGLVEVYRRNT